MMYQAENERYQKMKYRNCGNSGLKFPELSLGFWHNFGSSDNYENMKRLCFTAFDCGITHFDLADNYGPAAGAAEENLGRILSGELGSYRDELIISTKSGYGMWEGPYGEGGSRKHLLAGIDQSLKRMNLDYVDIFYHHVPDAGTPIEESMLALHSIVQSGKALYIGISNYDLPMMKKAAEILRELRCPFIVNQRRYSIFDRTVEVDGTKKWAGENGIGMIAFSPLAQGLLSGRYLRGIPEDSRIKKDGRFLNENDLKPGKLAQIQKLQKIAERRGEGLAQMALAWVLRDKEFTSAIIGASKPEQIIKNCKMLDSASFTEQELADIEAICTEREKV